MLGLLKHVADLSGLEWQRGESQGGQRQEVALSQHGAKLLM